jgi:RsiW-degrading membrane proteinase PrsW (M82 family)
MSIISNLIASIITAIIVLLYVRLFLDHNIKTKELWITFLVSLIGALIVTSIAYVVFGIAVTQYNFGSPLLFSLLWSLLGIAILQVSSKILLIKICCMRRKSFGHLVNGIVYGIIISLGFGVLDSFFYTAAIGIFASFYGIE